jgi:ubiquinone/menaquinone biosynthesis C-methylase UbiE
MVSLFNLFRPFGLDVPGWRREAIQMLDLTRGDMVVDIGCGTGLNFPLLQEVIGSEGKIIGVDLSDAMLDKARRRALENDWKNVELVCMDAT